MTVVVQERLLGWLDLAAATAIGCFVASLVYSFSNDVYHWLVDIVVQSEQALLAMMR